MYCCRHLNAIRLRISGTPGQTAGAAGGGGEAAATRGASIATAAGATPVARYAPSAARLWQVRVFIHLRFIQLTAIILAWTTYNFLQSVSRVSHGVLQRAMTQRNTN